MPTIHWIIRHITRIRSNTECIFQNPTVLRCEIRVKVSNKMSGTWAAKASDTSLTSPLPDTSRSHYRFLMFPPSQQLTDGTWNRTKYILSKTRWESTTPLLRFTTWDNKTLLILPPRGRLWMGVTNIGDRLEALAQRTRSIWARRGNAENSPACHS